MNGKFVPYFANVLISNHYGHEAHAGWVIGEDPSENEAHVIFHTACLGDGEIQVYVRFLNTVLPIKGHHQAKACPEWDLHGVEIPVEHGLLRFDLDDVEMGRYKPGPCVSYRISAAMPEPDEDPRKSEDTKSVREVRAEQPKGTVMEKMKKQNLEAFKVAAKMELGHVMINRVRAELQKMGVAVELLDGPFGGILLANILLYAKESLGVLQKNELAETAVEAAMFAGAQDVLTRVDVQALGERLFSGLKIPEVLQKKEK